MATNKHQRRVYVLVNGDARKLMNEKGRVNVGFRSLRVVDNIALLQCYKCLAFGNTTARCVCVCVGGGGLLCGFCAGTYRTSSCNVRDEPGVHKCYKLCASHGPRPPNKSPGHFLGVPILQNGPGEV